MAGDAQGRQHEVGARGGDLAQSRNCNAATPTAFPLNALRSLNLPMLACRLSPRERQTDQDLDAVPPAPPGPACLFDRALAVAAARALGACGRDARLPAAARRRRSGRAAVDHQARFPPRGEHRRARRLAVAAHPRHRRDRAHHRHGPLARSAAQGLEQGDWRVVADEEALPFAAPRSTSPFRGSRCSW